MTETATAEPAARPRRNDRARAQARAAEAVRLRTAGYSYDQIARTLGYANRGTVHRMVAGALSARVAQEVDAYRDTALARLEALLRALWPRGTAGDLAAVRELAQLILAEARLLGLLSSTGSPLDGPPSGRRTSGPSVVIGPEDPPSSPRMT